MFLFHEIDLIQDYDYFQVAEDFFVREVSNPVEMANYLVTMTKHLIAHFKVNFSFFMQ
jgi:hypothetical protein